MAPRTVLTSIEPLKKQHQANSEPDNKKKFSKIQLKHRGWLDHCSFDQSDIYPEISITVARTRSMI
jgi:hypothetical protein